MSQLPSLDEIERAWREQPEEWPFSQLREDEVVLALVEVAKAAQAVCDPCNVTPHKFHVLVAALARFEDAKATSDPQGTAQ